MAAGWTVKADGRRPPGGHYWVCWAVCGIEHWGWAELVLPQLPARPAADVAPRRLRRQPAPRCAVRGWHYLSRASVPARTDRRLWCGTKRRAAPVSKAKSRTRTRETERTKPERAGVLAAAEGGGTFSPTAAPTYAPPLRPLGYTSIRVYISCIGLPVSIWLHLYAYTLAHKHTHTHTRARAQ